jgi:FkbM family methyltransferase
MASVTRKYPFYTGCGRLANHRLMKILAPASPDLVWAKLARGNLRVPLDGHVGRAVYFFGDLDPKLIWILKRLLRPGDYVLDVGANFGLLTLLMSKLVGPEGTVDAFEPNPILCHILEKMLAHNSAANVRLHPIALGCSDGEMALHVPKGNFGAGSLVRKTDQAAHVHVVPIKKLDEVILPRGISKIALIKLDVEGFELEVFRGHNGFSRRSALLQSFSNQTNTQLIIE